MKIKTDNKSIVQEFKSFESYRKNMGFSSLWPELTRMIEGDQWPPITEKTKFMPRPVVNQLDFIVENKKSNILSQSLKFVYRPEELPKNQIIEDFTQAGEDFTDAAANTWEDIEQDSLNEDYVNDILGLGTGIFHYYFDNSITGGQFTHYVGKLQGQTIDPMDIALANPRLPASKTQKQPWITIRATEDTSELIEIAKKHGENWQQIVPNSPNSNESQYKSEQLRVDGVDETTTYTKYYKENGQVYWVKVTETATIRKPRPLAPDSFTLDDGTSFNPKPFTIYPVEIGVFKQRRKCTFGRSVVEDSRNNQIALNWGIGMMLLSVQQTAWPKIIAKVGALTQSITNEPGEILTDNYSGNGEGIKFMQPPNFSQMPMFLTEKLLDMVRQVTGTTEVNTGEVIGANMAAAAIVALQSQAKKPNESYTNKLLRSLKNVGRIYEEFYKCFYNLPRPVLATDKEGNEYTKNFTGSDHADKSFRLKIDVGPSTMLNESLQVTVLDKMADRQWVDKYQYIKYAPDNLLPQNLKQDFSKEAEQIAEQQQMMQQNGGLNMNKIMSNLTPEEQAVIQQNPALLQQVQGGGPNI